MKTQTRLPLAAWFFIAAALPISLRLLSRSTPTLANDVHTPTLTSATPRSGILDARDLLADINVRTAPGTQASIVTMGSPNAVVTILSESQHTDGVWYQVRLVSTGQEGWVRGDLVRTQTTNSLADPTNEPAIVNPSPEVNAVTDRAIALLDPRRSQPNQFTQAQIDYFMEIALGSEWGNSDQLIRKWNQNLRIKVAGTRTNEDIAALNTVIGEINGLINGSGVQLTLDDNNPNVEIIYASQTEFRRIEPNYAPGSSGFFRTFWDRGVINRARILITDSNRVSQRERSHVIREELTQIMGLVRDSWRYQDSIFYQGRSDVNQYSADDRALIQLLYLTSIQPGMSQSQVASALQTVLDQ